MSNELKIGNVILNNRIIVGPMAGVSNPSFRHIAKEFGAALVYSEMISDKAIHFKSKKTYEMMEIANDEKPLALQLFGSDIETMVEGAIYMDTKTDCDIIDINMGCPVRKVVTNNGGSALMIDPDHTVQLVKAVLAYVNKPVTVKMRAGWDLEHINCVYLAQELAKTGIASITLHPRTRTQFYSGHSDWNLIKQVKEVVTNIPVIGNGDIRSVKDLQEMKELTHCDGFMLARGVLGNPWLIKQCVAYDQTSEMIPDPDANERLDMCLRHAQLLIQDDGEYNGIREMRSHACWYVSPLPYANKVKAKINFMASYQRLEEIIENYRKAILTEDYSYFMEENDA